MFPQRPYEERYPGSMPPPPPTQTSYPGGYPGFTPGIGPGESYYGIDARIDRIEREILEINRRLNVLSRRLRRVENYLNIREDV